MMSIALQRLIRAAARSILFVLFGATIELPNAALGQPKPFQIDSISFPLIGSLYLDDVPGWTPIPAVIQQLKALGANDVKISVADGYHLPTDNLPDPALTASLNPQDGKIIAFIQQLKAEGLGVTLQPGPPTSSTPMATFSILFMRRRATSTFG